MKSTEIHTRRKKIERKKKSNKNFSIYKAVVGLRFPYPTDFSTKVQTIMESPLATTLGTRMSAYLITSNDFKKQRQKINKQIKNLRHELNLINHDSKKYKVVKFTKDQYQSNKNYGLIYLLLAERDFLYGLEMKNILEIDDIKLKLKLNLNLKLHKNYKKLLITKFKRSLIHAKELLDLTNEESINDIKVELFVYTALIIGQLSIVKKNWEKTLHAFSIAKCGLDYLYNTHNNNNNNNNGEDENNDDDEEEADSFNKTLFNELIETLVDPSLNLAISQLDIHSTTDLKSIARKHCHDNEVPYLTPVLNLIDSKYTTTADNIANEDNFEISKQVNWRDHSAYIYNDEVALKISYLNNNIHWDKSNDINQFDSIITQWNEILSLHKSDTERNQDDDDLEQVQNRAILLTYINYNLLFTTLKRDLLLIGQLAKIDDNKDIIRLFNGILVIVQNLKDLPGVYNDEDLYDSLDNLEKFFIAQKNQVIAESYQFNSQFAELLKIYQFINQEISNATTTKQGSSSFYKTDFPFNISTNEQIAIFKNDITKKILQNQISAQFEQSKVISSSPYTIENLNKYPKGLTTIINLNKIEPMMCKPVLFDVAFNYISYDSTKQITTNTATTTPVETSSPDVDEAIDNENSKKRGFFGIFGRR